jgi:dTDP-4-dehydrorhamnose 3,5-epimerase (EC 5.1.3.13)
VKVEETILDGALIITPDVFGDERGFFLETFNEKRYRSVLGESISFVQDNYSRSQKKCPSRNAFPNKKSTR